MKLLENPEEKCLVNVCKICRILAVNPALMRRVKTWMRSTVLPTHFNSVASFNFHKDRTDKLDLIKIVNAFIQSDENANIWKIYKERLIITIRHSL